MIKIFVRLSRQDCNAGKKNTKNIEQSSTGSDVSAQYVRGGHNTKLN